MLKIPDRVKGKSYQIGSRDGRLDSRGGNPTQEVPPACRTPC